MILFVILVSIIAAVEKYAVRVERDSIDSNERARARRAVRLTWCLLIALCLGAITFFMLRAR